MAQHADLHPRTRRTKPPRASPGDLGPPRGANRLGPSSGRGCSSFQGREFAGDGGDRSGRRPLRLPSPGRRAHIPTPPQSPDGRVGEARVRGGEEGWARAATPRGAGCAGAGSGPARRADPFSIAGEPHSAAGIPPRGTLPSGCECAARSEGAARSPRLMGSVVRGAGAARSVRVSVRLLTAPAMVPCAWAHPSRTQSGAILRPRAPARPGPGQKVWRGFPPPAGLPRPFPAAGALRPRPANAGPASRWATEPPLEAEPARGKAGEKAPVRPWPEARRQPGGRGCARRGSEPFQFLRGCEQCLPTTGWHVGADYLTGLTDESIC